VITVEEQRKYLGAFNARGSGSVRGTEVGKTTAQIDGKNILVTFYHSKYGVVQVTFTDVFVNYCWTYKDYESIEERDLNELEDAAKLIELGTWGINLEDRVITAHFTNWRGYYSTYVKFTDISLALPDNIPNDGTCTVCGSEEFVLRSFGTQRLKVIGPYTFESTAPATLKILNAIPHIQCASCDTEHSSSGSFNGGFVVDGRSNRREDIMHDTKTMEVDA
jgi:hypothetical protein